MFILVVDVAGMLPHTLIYDTPLRSSSVRELGPLMTVPTKSDRRPIVTDPLTAENRRKCSSQTENRVIVVRAQCAVHTAFTKRARPGEVGRTLAWVSVLFIGIVVIVGTLTIMVGSYQAKQLLRKDVGHDVEDQLGNDCAPVDNAHPPFDTVLSAIDEHVSDQDEMYTRSESPGTIDLTE